MSTLLAFGRAAVPLAFDLTLKTSIAAGAVLLAVRIIGPRHPARCFALVVAALLGGTAAGVISFPVRPFAIPIGIQNSGILPAPPLSVTTYRGRFDVRVGTGEAGSLGIVVPASRRSRSPLDWLGALGLVWIAGILMIGIYRVLGTFSLYRMLAGARLCRDARLLAIAAAARERLGCTFKPRILISPTAGTAYTAGIIRPAIVLPLDASSWPDGRAVSALFHETVHVMRCDNLVAELIRVLIAPAWISPLPWLAFSLAKHLREEACDEAVLGAGIAPVGYAGDLLEAARSVSRGCGVSVIAATMTGVGNLEKRIRAVLSWSRHAARPFSRLRATAAGLVLAAAAAASLLVGAAAPQQGRVRGAQIWNAVATHPTSARRGAVARASFSVVQAENSVEIDVQLGHRTIALTVPAPALPTVLPLGLRARLARPFGNCRDPKTQNSYFNLGWDMRSSRDSRSIPIVAAAPGTVISNGITSDEGLIIEIDHGFGLRTRYGLGLHGSGTVALGTKVAAGDPIGFFGPARSSVFGQPDDIPILHFLVFAEIGNDQLVALDPAPLVLSTPVNRNMPLATAVMNAAVRAADRDEVSRLIALGVGLNTAATDGTIPLEWTVVTQNAELAKALVEAGADPAAKIRTYGFTVADLVRGTGNPDLIAAVATL